MKGLKSFSISTDFFLSEEMKAIRTRFGYKAELVVVRLLCMLFSNGYYAKMPVTLANIVLETGFKESFVREVVSLLISCGFFDETLASQVGILTSKAIQKEYFKQVHKNHHVLTEELPYILDDSLAFFKNKKSERINKKRTQKRTQNKKANAFLESTENQQLTLFPDFFAEKETEEKERKKEKEKSPPITPSKEKEINKEKEEKENVPLQSRERVHTHVGEGGYKPPKVLTDNIAVLRAHVEVEKENLTKEKEIFCESESTKKARKHLESLSAEMLANTDQVNQVCRIALLPYFSDLTPFVEVFNEQQLLTPSIAESKNAPDYVQHFTYWLKSKIRFANREKEQEEQRKQQATRYTTAKTGAVILNVNDLWKDKPPQTEPPQKVIDLPF